MNSHLELSSPPSSLGDINLLSNQKLVHFRVIKGVTDVWEIRYMEYI